MHRLPWLLPLLLSCGCGGPARAPDKTWSHPANPITVTGPSQVKPGESHTFQVTWTKGTEKGGLSVRVFGDGEVVSIGGSRPTVSGDREFRDFASNLQPPTQVEVKVGDKSFVPLFGLQRSKTVPLGLLMEFHVGSKSQSVEVRAEGVEPYRP